MAVYISPIASITPQICSEQATRQPTTTTISERPKMRTRSWVNDGGGDASGVRPSPGAAMLESGGDVMESGASAGSVLAAPEDGRTPPKLSPAFSDRLRLAAVLSQSVIGRQGRAGVLGLYAHRQQVISRDARVGHFTARC